MPGVIRKCSAISWCVLSVVIASGLIDDPRDIQNFLTEFNRMGEQVFYDYMESIWNYRTNMTDYNEELMMDEMSWITSFLREAYLNASMYNLSSMSKLDRRQFVYIMSLGTDSSTNDTQPYRLQTIVNTMIKLYSSHKSSAATAESTNVSREQDYNRNMKALYTEYVNLSNEAAQRDGYNDTGDLWRSLYESPTFEDDVRELFEQLRPLYEQLHAYVLRKLIAVHGKDEFPSSGHIPIHFMDNLKSPMYYPYPNKSLVDVTPEMIRQNYTVRRIFEMADDFFKSMGMMAATPEFWNKSMLEQPSDGRLVDCMGLALDFRNGKDFRIKQCTTIDAYGLFSSHHEMGHIQYFMQYAHQPIVFRQGANSALHEAIGDVISLSVKSEKHLHTIGLLDSFHNDNESDINLLMSHALSTVMILPYYYLIDQWRWKVFRGEITPDKYNEQWLNLTCLYEGVSLPVQNSSDEFHPGSIYHIIANVPYVRYFLGVFLNYQIHGALCKASGHLGPLHKCDIYNSTEAGKKLRQPIPFPSATRGKEYLYKLFLAKGEALKLGASEPSSTVLQLLTGNSKIDAAPLLEFFKPLMDYLETVNQNDHGWDPVCPSLAPKLCKADAPGNCTCKKHSDCEGRGCCKKGICKWDKKPPLRDLAL